MNRLPAGVLQAVTAAVLVLMVSVIASAAGPPVAAGDQSPVSPAEEPAEEPTERVRIEQLAWMAGRWTATDENRSTEEVWLAPKGGIMLALHREVSESGSSFFEFLRIAETDATLIYFASPLGRPPVEFRLEELTESHVVFTNPEHDFPQRIEYLLDDDDTLVARVSAETDGQTRGGEWRWQRAAE